MSAYVVIGGNLAGQSFSINGTNFFPLGGSTDANGTTEQPQQWEASDSYTATNYGVNLSQNSYTTTATFRTRIGGVNGNLAISIASAGTGWLSDSSHSDSISATNLLNGSFVATTSATAATLRQLSLELTGSDVMYVSAGANFSPGTSTLFLSTQGGIATVFNSKAETWANYYISAAGTLAFLSVNLDATTAQIWTIRCRIGAANKNQVVSVAASSTPAIYRDTSHTDSVVAANLVDTSVTEATTFSGAAQGFSYQFTPTTSGQVDLAGSISASGATNWAAGQTTFVGFGGFQSTGVAEASSQAEIPYAVTSSNLRVLLPVTTNCSMTTTLRINNGNGTQTTSTSSGATNPGWVLDNSHTDSIASGIVFSLKVVSGAGSSTSFSQTGLTIASAGSETGTAVLTFSGISFVASGTREETGTGTLAFGGIAIVGSGSRVETGTGRLTFSGISIVGVGHDYLPGGTGVLAFSGISIVGTGDRVETGTGALHFSGIGFSAAGTVKHTGVGLLHFSGISILAFGTIPTGQGKGQHYLIGQNI